MTRPNRRILGPLTLSLVLAALAGADTVRLRSGSFTLNRTPDARQAVGPAGLQRLIARFPGPLTELDRTRLTERGVRFVQPLGGRDWIVRADTDAIAACRDLVPDLMVAPVRAEMKRDQELGGRAFVSAERRALDAGGRVRLRVHLFRDASAAGEAAVREAIGRIAGARAYPSNRVAGNLVFTVEAPDASVGAIAALGAVQFIEDAPEITYRNSTATGVVQSNDAALTPLWDNGLHGEGQIIGVADSGIDETHCAFTDDPTKLVAYNGDPSVTSHGTHVSCIAVGNANSGGDLRGNAYEARLVFSRTPAFTTDDLTSVFETASGQGARVHTNSWGDDSTNAYTGLARAIDAYMHEHEDELVLFAVTNTSLLKSPENAKNCVSVAASNDSPTQDVFCRGGTGLTTDGRYKPDLYAPGCNIRSAQSQSGCGAIPSTGTSMATPAVAGVASMMRQFFMDGYYPTGLPNPADALTPTGALLKAMLANTATGMAGVPDLPSQASAFTGWGRILADDAVALAGDARTLYIEDRRHDAGVTTASVVEHTFDVTSPAQELRVTLAWSDPPPAPGAVEALVNNLDLELVGPDATVYRGNNFIGGLSIAGGVPDTLNNLEQIWLDAPDAGLWTVRIIGASIAEGMQGYALVATGAVLTPPRPLTLAVADPPALLAPNDPGVTFDITIDEGDDALVGGSPTLHYRYQGAAFRTAPLAPAGASTWTATLPSASCPHDPEYFVTATGLTTGTVSVPAGGPATALAAVVGEFEEIELLSEDFAGGLPPGWTATGLWSVTNFCQRTPLCDAAPWAYFGDTGSCTYGVGATVSGSLTTDPIALPALAPGESLTLRYCSSMENENVSRFDLGRVLVDGVEVDLAPDTALAWQVRSVDLSPFAGQSVQIAWFFDSEDAFANNFGGWQVDGMEIVLTAVECDDPCPGDVNGDGVVDVFDFADLAAMFGLNEGATRSDGDLNGNGAVDVFDFADLAAAFGTNCDA